MSFLTKAFLPALLSIVWIASAHAQSSTVHGLATSATVPIISGSCMYLDQGPGADTKLCPANAAGWQSAFGFGNLTVGPGSSVGTDVAAWNNTTGSLLLDTGIPYSHLATAASPLTANQLVIGSGGQAEAILGTLGTTTTVLHGNASGAPSFGAVSLATDVAGSLPYANLPALAANQLLGALSAATPSGIAFPACSGASQAINWTAGTGPGCVTISGGTPSFSTLTSGTNTGAAMVVGSGASIAAAGGTITATAAPVSGLTGIGSGVATALGVATGSAGAFVVNGGALGTPSSGTLTNATGLPLGTGVTGTLLAAQFPALTGVVTTAAGSLATAFETVGAYSSGNLHLFGNPTASVAAPQDTTLAAGSNITITCATTTCTLASSAGGGSVTSVALTVPGSSIFGVTGSPITTAGTLAITTTGTSGGIPYFSSTAALSSSAALGANLPVIGGGAGVAPTTGTRSGNTTIFATANGTLTSGHCVSIDASSNFVDAGGVCTTGGGGGTVTSGTVNQLAWYSATGTAVAGLATANSGVLITSGTGVPSISSTLPSGLTIPGYNASITWPTTGNVVIAGGNAPTGVAPGTTDVLYSVTAGGGWTAAALPSLAVTSLSGTAGQIVASASVGPVTLSLPTTITQAETFSSITTQAAPWQSTATDTIPSSANATLDDIAVIAETATITGTTGISSNVGFNKVSLYQPTLTDASAVTVTNAATLYVDNAPAAGGSVTITNPYAIRVRAGNVSFPGAANALGTITSGTWNGTVIGSAFGGTGLASPAAGGILLANGASAMNLLAPVNNDLIYGFGSAWTALASAASSVLVTNSSSLPGWATTLPAGLTIPGYNATVTWPTTGDIVIAGGNSPTGVVPGTGILAALAVNVGAAGAPVLFNGAGGTPSSITLTNGTALPLTGLGGAVNGDCILGNATPAWTASATCDLTNVAQTLTAVKTFNNSDLAILGSGAGATTFTSANATPSNFTVTIPANTGTLGELNLAQTWSALQTYSSGLTISGGTFTATGLVTLANLATQASNTVLVNSTSSTASPTAQVVASCSAAVDALIWTTNTGFGCNAAVNAALLNGATFAAPGAIGGTTPSTGAFTTITATGGIAAGGATLQTQAFSVPNNFGYDSVTTGATVVPLIFMSPANTVQIGNGSTPVLLNGTTLAAPGIASASGPFCLQVAATGSGSFITNTGSACGSGSGAVSSVNNNGNGIVVGGSGTGPYTGAVTVGITSPDNAFSANHTVAATDMAGTMSLTGSAMLTIPAISTTVFAAGMTSCYQNQGAGTWTISTTPTINGLYSLSVGPGMGGCLISNGTTLDWQAGAQPASNTQYGVVSFGANNSWTGVSSFGEVHGTVSAATLTTNNYSAAVGNCAAIIYLPTGTTPTVTLPNIAAPPNNECHITFITSVAISYQFIPSGSGIIHNSQNFTHTRGTNAGDVVNAILQTPSPTNAVWTITGDLTS